MIVKIGKIAKTASPVIYEPPLIWGNYTMWQYCCAFKSIEKLAITVL
jgi:hypothetical protein